MYDRSIVIKKADNDFSVVVWNHEENIAKTEKQQ